MDKSTKGCNSVYRKGAIACQRRVQYSSPSIEIYKETLSIEIELVDMWKTDSKKRNESRWKKDIEKRI